MATVEELREALRWCLQEYFLRGMSTPETFTTQYGEAWEREGTRAHIIIEKRNSQGGTFRVFEREERRGGSKLAVEDEHAEIISQLVVGRTITGFRRETDPTVEWAQGQNSVTIALDDGSTLYFNGWGYDESGLATTYEYPESSS